MSSIWWHHYVLFHYHRTGFDSKVFWLRIASFLELTIKGSQWLNYTIIAATFDHALLIRQSRGICCRVSEMSIRRYFKPTVNLPTTNQVQMSPEILKKSTKQWKRLLSVRKKLETKTREVKSESTPHLSRLRIVLLCRLALRYRQISNMACIALFTFV